MENQTYREQVSLLLDVLPEVAKETRFALHGGTAINLFYRDMPRLSVDIDLTYIPIEDRETSIKNIGDALERIHKNVLKIVKGSKVIHQKEISKLQISINRAQIKLEVNLTNRGILDKPVTKELCDIAQNEFDRFSSIQTVGFGQLYGGKICAALDRQHPRDLFDVKYLLDNEGFTDEVKTGFLLCLLSSNRPIHELLNPHRIDQKNVMENQFVGMSKENFTYKEFELTRERLIETVNGSFNDNDKKFLLSFENTEPNWSVYDFEKFPSVQWKLQNLIKLKSNNPKKHQALFNQLKELLSK